MSFTVSEFGGLAVAFNPVDERQIQQALTRLDPGLFLDPEVEPRGPHGAYVYMTVKHHIGSGVPPAPVLEWRDSYGPKPLTMAIVEHVKRREGALDGAVERAVKANERIRERAIQDIGDRAYDVGLEAKKAQGKTSALLPRGQSLRQSRDRARARGKKV